MQPAVAVRLAGLPVVLLGHGQCGGVLLSVRAGRVAGVVRVTEVGVPGAEHAEEQRRATS